MFCSTAVAGLCATLLLAACARVPDGASWSAATPLAAGTFAQMVAQPRLLPVRAGETIVVSARQQDVDVTLQLSAADGRVLSRSAAPGGARGREWLVWEATRAETVQVTVALAADAEVAPSSRVELALLRMPATLPGDLRQAWQAQRAALDAATPELAVTRWQDAERRWHGLAQRELAAEAALQRAAVEYQARQQWSAAVEAAERAEEGFREAGEPALQADASLLRGAARAELAVLEPQAPATLFEQPLKAARRSFQQLGAPVAAAEALNFEGVAQFNRGDAQAAARLLAQAAREFETVGAPVRHRMALLNLASIQFDRGDYRGAAQSFERLLQGPPPPDADILAIMLLNSAWSLTAIGELERALARSLEALDVTERAGDGDLRGRALQGLGVVHLRLGQANLAIGYLRQAVALAETGSDPVKLAAWRDNLGSALREAGRLDEATRQHAAAVAALGDSGRLPVRGRVLLSLARDRADAGDWPAALRGYDAVLALGLPAGSTTAIRARIGRASMLAALGRRPAAVGELDRAIELAAAQELVEEGSFALAERARLHEASGDRAAALEDSARAVALTRRLTAAATNPDNRVTYAQRVRGIQDLRIDLLAREGRALEALAVADLANGRGIWSRSGARSAGAATGGESALYEMLAERRHRLETLAEQGPAAEPRVRAIEAEMSVLRSRLAQARAGRAGDARDAGDAGDVGAAMPDLRRLPAAMRPGDVLLVYSVGRERGWLWLVRAQSLQLVALPGAARVDAAVRRLLENVRQLAPHDAALRALRETILPGVPADTLAGQRLLVVADGALGAVPWALLQAQLSASASLQLARAADVLDGEPRTEARGRTAPAGWRWALFGDPAFGRDDRSLARLPGTAAELAAVGRWARPELRKVYAGTDATREALLALPAAQVDVLHVATHARLDAVVPELAALVLARVDAQGRRLAGDVRAADLLAWRQAPPLVVLSACDAAAEPSTQAAGLMSLTRALLARGSQHVVASLWPVADASAADFMTAFYGALVEQGMPPDRALAEAQRRLAASKRWSAPFFWAGFVVHGAGP